MRVFTKSGACLRVCDSANSIAVDSVKALSVLEVPPYTVRLKMDDPADLSFDFNLFPAVTGETIPIAFWGDGLKSSQLYPIYNFPSTGTYDIYINYPFKLSPQNEIFEWLDVRRRQVEMPNRGDSEPGNPSPTKDFSLSSYAPDCGKPYNGDEDFSLEEMWQETDDLTDIPDWEWSTMTGVVDMTRAFSSSVATYFSGTNFLNFAFPANAIVYDLLYASNFNGDVSNWDVSLLKNFNGLFFDTIHQFNTGGSFTNGGISGLNVGLDTWDTSSATDMQDVFRSNGNFNCRLDSWNTSSVTTMQNMFLRCTNFNNGGVSGVGLGIDNWDVSNVQEFRGMFARVADPNVVGTTVSFYLGSWDTSSATDMGGMFSISGYDDPSIGNWDVSNVQNFATMFGYGSQFNQPLSNWNTSSATTMYSMFGHGLSTGDPVNPFNQDLGNWNVSSVQNFSYMFANSLFNNGGVGGANLGLDRWNTSSATTMEFMFGELGAGSAVFNHPLPNWDVSNVTNMQGMFNGNTVFDQDLSTWDLNSLTICIGMFGGNSALSDANVQNILVGWSNNTNTNTGVNANNLFGNRTMSIASYSSAKSAYDNLAAPVSSGGKEWDLTNAITWVP